MINIASRVPVTEAEGPGKRFAIWVQGCPLRCPGCCNPQYLEFRDTELLTPRQLLDEVLEQRDKIEGVTFIGGEPFSQASQLAELASGVQDADLSVMVFTGHLIDELTEPAHKRMLAQTDLLVDGPFDKDQPDRRRRWDRLYESTHPFSHGSICEPPQKLAECGQHA